MKDEEKKEGRRQKAVGSTPQKFIAFSLLPSAFCFLFLSSLSPHPSEKT